MFSLPYPVYLLAVAQALGMCTSTLIIFVGGILGASLAPTPSLATLPIAALIVGSALTSMPAALIMQKVGRKAGFIGATLCAAAGAILAYISVVSNHFWGLCFSITMLGMQMAFVQQLRFAALEWVDSGQAGQTASVVLLGGLVAAWVGPELGMVGQFLTDGAFSGSFLLLAGLHVLLLILFVAMPFAPIVIKSTEQPGRSTSELLKSPAILAAIVSGAVAFGVMSMIMTGTPVSMSKLDGFPLEETKTVIQSHILAMFIPSLFAAYLFKYLGLISMLLVGLAALTAALSIALLDQSYWGYWSALVFLGVGWNFLFVGGTSLLSQSYAPHESFKVQAVNEVAVFGTQAILSLSAGWLVFSYGWHVLNLMAVPMLMLGLIVIMRWHLKAQRSSFASPK